MQYVYEMQVIINQVKNDVNKLGKDSTIIFVKKWEQHGWWTRKVDKLEILHEAKEWVTEVDLDQQFLFL